MPFGMGLRGRGIARTGKDGGAPEGGELAVLVYPPEVVNGKK